MRSRLIKAGVLKLPKPPSKKRQIRNPRNPDHGREIFIYNQVQTNQVVYSLSKALDNNDAMRQLPYNGKKTKPSSLRKDLWSPLAHVILSSPSPSAASAIGLKIFQKLREYKKLHETLWPKELAYNEKGKRLTRVERGRKLNDQKANSIADLAAALEGVQDQTQGKIKDKSSRSQGRDGKLGKETEIGEDGKAEGETPKVMATVRWKDVLDAEFAESWPGMVVHDRWITRWNNRRIWIDHPDVIEEPKTEARKVEVASEAAMEPTKVESGRATL